MKARQLVAIMLLVVVGSALAGCGGDTPTATPVPVPTSTPPPPSPVPPTDTALPPTATIVASTPTSVASPTIAAVATTAIIFAGPTGAGPTPTSVTMPLAASDGHHTAQDAFVMLGPMHVDLTLASSQDVVYFSFRTSAPASVGLWFYNPQDAEGTLKVQLLDAGEQKELNADTLNPGDQSSLSTELPTPALYLIKVTAGGLTKVPQTPVQVELDSLDPMTPTQ